MDCGHPDCREDILGKIKETAVCVKTKMATKTFTSIIITLMLVVGGAIGATNWKLANCADEEKVNNLENAMIAQTINVKNIDKNIEKQTQMFEKFIEKMKKNEKEQEKRISDLENRLSP